MRIVSVHKNNNKFKRFFLLQISSDAERQVLEESIRESEKLATDDMYLAKSTPLLKKILSRLSDKYKRPEEKVAYSAVISESEMRSLALYFWMTQMNYVNVQKQIKSETAKGSDEEKGEVESKSSASSEPDQQEENASAFSYQRKISSAGKKEEDMELNDASEAIEEEVQDFRPRRIKH